MVSVFCLVFKQSLSLRVKILNLTWPGITCSRIRTAWPKWLILASFFSGENTPSIDTSHYLQLLPEVCRSVLFGPPCMRLILKHSGTKWDDKTSKKIFLGGAPVAPPPGSATDDCLRNIMIDTDSGINFICRDVHMISVSSQLLSMSSICMISLYNKTDIYVPWYLKHCL